MESVSDEVRRDSYTPDCLACTSFALGVFGCAVGAHNLKACLQLSLVPPRRAFNFCNSLNQSFVDSTIANTEDVEMGSALFLLALFALASFYLIFFHGCACMRICCTRANPEIPGTPSHLHCGMIIPLGTYGMAFVTSSVVFDKILVSMQVPKTNKVHILSDVLLLLGSCIQISVHAIFFVTYVMPLAYHLVRCRLGNLDHKFLPEPAWFPCIVGIASIVTATERIFPANMPDPNLPDIVDPDLVLMTLRCILVLAVTNMAVFVPVVTARSWKDVVQRCNICARVFKDGDVTGNNHKKNVEVIPSDQTTDASANAQSLLPVGDGHTDHPPPPPLFAEPTIAVLGAPCALVSAATLSPTLHTHTASSLNLTEWDGDTQYVLEVQEFAVVPMVMVYVQSVISVVVTLVTCVEAARRWRYLVSTWKEGLSAAAKWGAITFPSAISAAVPLLLYQRIFPVSVVCGNTRASPARAWWFPLVVLVGVIGCVFYFLAFVSIAVVNVRFLTRLLCIIRRGCGGRW